MIHNMARRRLEFVAMTLVALVVAHNLVFVLAYGPAYGQALARTGHGDAWQTAVITVLVAGASLLGIALWRLHRLGRSLPRGVGARPTRPSHGSRGSNADSGAAGHG